MNILIENGLISKEGKINSVILFGSCYVFKFDSSKLPISLLNKFKKKNSIFFRIPINPLKKIIENFK